MAHLSTRIFTMKTKNTLIIIIIVLIVLIVLYWVFTKNVEHFYETPQKTPFTYNNVDTSIVDKYCKGKGKVAPVNKYRSEWNGLCQNVGSAVDFNLPATNNKNPKSLNPKNCKDTVQLIFDKDKKGKINYSLDAQCITTTPAPTTTAKPTTTPGLWHTADWPPFGASQLGQDNTTGFVKKCYSDGSDPNCATQIVNYCNKSPDTIVFISDSDSNRINYPNMYTTNCLKKNSNLWKKMCPKYATSQKLVDNFNKAFNLSIPYYPSCPI